MFNIMLTIKKNKKQLNQIIDFYSLYVSRVFLEQH